MFSKLTCLGPEGLGFKDLLLDMLPFVQELDEEVQSLVLLMIAAIGLPSTRPSLVHQQSVVD